MGANSFFSRTKDMLSRVVDSFIPMAEEDEYEEEELQEQHVQNTAVRTQQAAVSERRVANGGTVSFSSSAYTAPAAPVRPSSGDGAAPPLTVHTTKVSELKVRIHRPRRYDDAGPAVIQLKQGIAVAVNFDCLNEAERRRVCDFLNGACYVLHGSARVVSSGIILYAPKGVDVTEAVPASM
ncbi:cell division protein SepF [uncultured Selenomonas sp.]|uniref:cell division protein SepF n=1 Tax=uncultured Selenomonas sp. TaxID=159275 RepID=UPI0028D6D93D|nr:cell division protein SepF [uncultured Selenomonas sp.]